MATGAEGRAQSPAHGTRFELRPCTTRHVTTSTARDAPPPERSARRSRRDAEVPTATIAAAIALAGSAVILLWFAYAARWGVLMVYLSALVAIGISPLAGWIEQRHIPGTHVHPPRWLAALAVYVVLFGGMAALAVAVVPSLVDQAQQLAHNWPALLARAEAVLVRHGALPRQMSAHELLQQVPDDVRAAVLRQFWNVIGGAVGLVFILVLSLYLLHDAERLRAVMLSFVPRPRRAQVRTAVDQVANRIGAWMTGQLMLSGIIAASTALGLGLMGIPYFYVLAVIAAVGELIPYAGPIAAAIPGILVALTASWETALAVAGFYFAQQQFENHVLVPKLMQHQVGLTSSVVIIAIMIGSSVLGVLGAMIAVPTAAIVQVAVTRFGPDDGGVG
jgi:predicted PurR-regulated permease PerM